MHYRRRRVKAPHYRHIRFWLDVYAQTAKQYVIELPWKLRALGNRFFVCPWKKHHVKMDSLGLDDSHGHCYRCGRWVWR